MKQPFRMIMLVLFSLFIHGCATQASSSNQPNQTVLLIDLSELAKATGKQEKLNKQMKHAENQISEQMNELKSKIKVQLEAEQAKASAAATKEAEQQFQMFLGQAQQQLQAAQIAANSKIQEYRVKLLDKYKREIKPHAEKLAKARNASLVQYVDEKTLWFNPSVDITQAMIKILNSEKKAN